MRNSDIVAIDPEVLGGTPVFRGTRVPVQSLFDYLERDYTLSEFLECFPSVPREMAASFWKDPSRRWWFSSYEGAGG